MKLSYQESRLQQIIKKATPNIAAALQATTAALQATPVQPNRRGNGRGSRGGRGGQSSMVEVGVVVVATQTRMLLAVAIKATRGVHGYRVYSKPVGTYPLR
ncbi:hypothetical protein CRG98_023778 [Punica granatum]|uniref:Uncharacterized protein n=1 Tax=Punica granatum TaxID=22663 RepID=A0A2I0JJV0_PUNGR|nr:hypothetical protein CRG98_023778 [Punica granatum]